MSSGQQPRNVRHFPRMKYRAEKRQVRARFVQIQTEKGWPATGVDPFLDKLRYEFARIRIRNEMRRL